MSPKAAAITSNRASTAGPTTLKPVASSFETALRASSRMLVLKPNWLEAAGTPPSDPRGRGYSRLSGTTHGAPLLEAGSAPPAR